jgi:hypothetical protein
MQTVTRNLIIKMLLIVIYFPLNDAGAQSEERFTVSGYVYEKGSRETLIGVNIYEPSSGIGAASNIYGYYAITLPAGRADIVFSYIGFRSRKEELFLNGNIRLDLEMEPGIEMDEVVITSETLRRISQNSQMSHVEVPILQALKIPSLLGEKDMFKVLQLMPGVQSGTEGTSGFYVRGGGPDQNLIILDDALVYNASHLFGFFSVFNGDAVKNMQLYKGGFPARFGGRLSSVLDIQMKDGNKEKLGGEAGLGIISSRLTLDGPFIKDKGSFLVSGRRTYLDLLVTPLLPEDSKTGYFFYDLNTKFNYEIDPNNRIFVSSYFGRDKFFFRHNYSSDNFREELDNGLYWQNATVTIRWNHIYNEKLFSNTSFIFSDYKLQIYSQEKFRDPHTNSSSNYELKYNSGIRDLGFKYDLSWYPLANHQIRSGIQIIHHEFTPSALVLRDEGIGRFENNAEKHPSAESGIYIEDEIRFGRRIRINPGIRISQFFIKGKSYHKIEPRFSSNVSMIPDLSWKFSYAEMNQYVHLLSSTGIGLPTDLWVPSTARIAPQSTWQLATGFAYDWLPRRFELSVEGYYKKSENIIGYREGASFLLIDDPTGAEKFSWQDNITTGQAWAYGLEFLLHRKQGRLSGWIGYTLSWIQHRFDDLNFGEKFWARYDRRHDISIVGVYEISPRMTFSATWVYATGNAFDLATGNFPVIPNQLHDQDLTYDNFWWGYATVYDKKNSFRAASYQRLDAGIQFHKDIVRFGQPVSRTIEVGAYNAYNRQNPFFYFWDSPHFADTAGTENWKLMQVSIFPIIPSISVNYKF